MPDAEQPPFRVPFVDLAAQYAEEEAEILACVEDVFTKGEFVGGASIGEFEAAISKTVGAGHTGALNSGTDALVLALKVLGVGPGDEVITVPNSFVASASCIALVGARPVFVDVDENYNMDPALIEAAITTRTRAILPSTPTVPPDTGRPVRASTTRPTMVRVWAWAASDDANRNSVPRMNNTARFMTCLA